MTIGTVDARPTNTRTPTRLLGAVDVSHRFENIDAMRGLAAVLVVWLHAADAFQVIPSVVATINPSHVLAEVLGVGRMGVVIFFAISGYVIVPTIRGPRIETIKDFLIKRFFRLYPLFWFAVITFAVAAWLETGKHFSLGVIAANLTMVPLEFGVRQVMGHFWTLEVELVFYVLVLTLFWCGALQRESLIAWSLLGVSIAWNLLYRTKLASVTVAHNMVWTFLPYFLSVMFWGAMIRARQWKKPGEHQQATRRRFDWPFVVVTALVFGRPLIAIFFGSPTVNQEDWRGTLLGLCLFVVIAFVPSRTFRSMSWLGTISYSVYLLHPVVFFPIVLASRSTSLANLPLGGYVLCAVAASIGLAGVTYRLIEAPSNAFARRLIR